MNALCQMTGVSRASYYRWGVPRPSFPVEMELRDQMQGIALQFPVYGYRRITEELNRRGFRRQSQAGSAVDAPGQPALSAAQGLRRDHRFAAQPAGVSELGARPRAQRCKSAVGRRHHYIRLHTEFVYLAVLLDAFSRRVIGWALGRRLEAGLALSAACVGLRPRSALSSAQVPSEWTLSTLPCNDFSANGDNPLNSLSHSRGSVQIVTCLV